MNNDKPQKGSMQKFWGRVLCRNEQRWDHPRPLQALGKNTAQHPHVLDIQSSGHMFGLASDHVEHLMLPNQ